MLKNNRGSFLVVSLVATALVLGLATYLYSSNYLNTKEIQDSPKEEVSQNEETVLAQVDQRNLAQAVRTNPTPTTPKPAPIVEVPVSHWVYSNIIGENNGEATVDVYYIFSASTPKAKLELTSILNKIRTDRYVVTAICPVGVSCNNLNNINASVSVPYKVETNIYCPASDPIYGATVIVRGMKWKTNLPNTSRQAAIFLTQSTWNLDLIAGDVKPVGCNLFKRSGRAGQIQTIAPTNPNLINGVDISNLKRGLFDK